MPIPIAAGLAAGSEILSTGINAVVQGAENKKARKFTRDMYWTERKNNLEDWAMQNQYNSPSEQMKRLREAGLNPNLVYGNGATTVSAQVKGASPGSPQTSAPKINLGGAATAYLNAQQMQLQNDNLTAQNKVLVEQAKNIAQDTLNKKFGTDLKEFDINFKTENRNRMLYKAEQSNINLFKQGGLTDAQIANTKERTATEIATRQPKVQSILQGVSESIQRILSMRIQAAKSQSEISYILTQIENAQKDGKLKDIDIHMKKHGVSWQDPAWQRKILNLLNL